MLFLPVLIWNAEHDWASFRFQLVRATATHGWSLRTVGEFIGLQFGLVGFILLPVVLSGLDVDGMARISPGRRRGHSAVDRGDRSLRLFLLEIADAAGRRYLADVHVADRICRRRHQYRDAAAGGLAGGDDQIGGVVGEAAIVSGIAFVVVVFFYYVATPWNFIGRADPIGGEAGYEQVVDRAKAELQKTGATWIATTDYRTYSMLRWFFGGRVPVIQINERGRYLGLSRSRHEFDQRAIPASMSGASPTTAPPIHSGRRRRRSASRSNGSSAAGAGS